MSRSRPAVIVVNSLVARGSVGGRAAVFALERLGFPVWFVPTVLLPWHPGHGPGTRTTIGPELNADIALSATAGDVAGILTGYFASQDQVLVAGDMVRSIRQLYRSLLYLCDPIVGDNGRFYVDAGIRSALRSLVGAADIVTPNRFELAFLAGVGFERLTDNALLVKAARSLGRPEVVVTSAFAGEAETANLLVTPQRAELVVHRVLPNAPNGTGDLLAALYLGHRLGGADPRDALARATSATFRLVELAGEARELPLAEGQDAFLAAPTGVSVRDLGDGGA